MSCDTTTTTTEKKIGNVKWFNNKAGYGFITMGENTGSPQDIFVHYTNISVGSEQYKYLVQGEYVEFDLTPTPEGAHEFQATNVTGIQGGATLCERRRQSREAADEAEDAAPQRLTRQSSAPTRRPPSKRPQKSTPQEVDEEGFRTVKRKPVARK
jgi:cold shock CspA family protein